MYLQYNFEIKILLQDSLQERDLTKISLNLKELELSRCSVGPGYALRTDRVLSVLISPYRLYSRYD